MGGRCKGINSANLDSSGSQLGEHMNKFGDHSLRIVGELLFIVGLARNQVADIHIKRSSRREWVNFFDRYVSYPNFVFQYPLQPLIIDRKDASIGNDNPIIPQRVKRLRVPLDPGPL